MAGTLGPDQQGQVFCLHKGERVSVFLSVPPEQAATSPWTAIALSDPAVLRRVPSGALTLVRGVTAGIFEGVTPGADTLSSSRPACAAATTRCAGPTRWQAEVVVQP